MSEIKRGRVVVIGDRVNLPLFRSVGLEVEEAVGDSRVIAELERVSSRPDVSLVIILKHVVDNIDKVIEKAEELGTPILILPTPWSPAEKINVEKLLAKALGLG